MCIGAQAAARSAPDGYTFFFATSAALVTNPYMVKNLSYDPVKDFCTGRARDPKSSDRGRESRRPRQELAGSDRARQSVAWQNCRCRWTARETWPALPRRRSTSAPERNSSLIPSNNINSGLQDTIAGRTQAGIFSASILELHLRSGALRALATASTHRLSAAPDIPAVAETLPGFDFSGWFMLMAPAGTPPDIIKKLNAAIEEATRDPQVRDLAPKLGFRAR